MFDYSLLSPTAAANARQAASRIKELVKPTAQLAIEIGRNLLTAKAALPHGQFLPWLAAEFGWSERTARNYMRLAETFKTETVADLNISLKALYLLSGADDDTRQAALEQAQQNGGLSYGEARAIIAPDRNESILITNGGPTPGPVYQEFESMLPLHRITLERTTTTTTTQTDAIHIEQPPALPVHLQKSFFVDPVMIYHDVPRLERLIGQLLELYQLAAGRTYPLEVRPQ